MGLLLSKTSSLKRLTKLVFPSVGTADLPTVVTAWLSYPSKRRAQAVGLLDANGNTSSPNLIDQTHDARSALELIEHQCLYYEAQSFRLRKEVGQRLDGELFDSRAMPDNLASARKSSLSYNRHVPPEILHTIFSHTLPDPPCDFTEWTSFGGPSVLAAVCGFWRVVALAHRELWSHIWIKLGPCSSKSLPTASRVKLFLERSGVYPLRIGLWDMETPLPETEEILRLLLPHSHRWRDVTFFVRFQHLRLMEQIRGRVPLLHSLHICIWEFPDGPYEVFRGFEDAPRLREATLRVGYRPIISLPWLQLTKVAGHIDGSAILQRASRTLDCIINFNYHTPSATSLVRHLALRKLRINVENPLNWLEAPNLEHLQIVGYANTKFIGHVVSFIQKSACSLRSLSLQRINLRDIGGLKALLGSVPCLLHLQLRFCDVDWAAVARILAIDDHSTPLVANLQHITIISGESDDVSPCIEPSVLDILETRMRSHDANRQGVTNLHSATLLNMRVSAQDAVQLSILQDLGLRVVQGVEARTV